MSEALKYLECAVECFVAAEETVIAAKTSEDLVRLTLTEDFSDCDLIEKVPTSLSSQSDTGQVWVCSRCDGLPAST